MRYNAEGPLRTPAIFAIRSVDTTDVELLELFGLGSEYQPAEWDDMDGRPAVFVARHGDWHILLDDYSYHYWHIQRSTDALADVGKTYELFHYVTGDADDSSEFMHYRDRSLARHYCYDDPWTEKSSVTVDSGSPLPGENGLADTKPYDRPPLIAAALGIRTEWMIGEVAGYSGPITEPVPYNRILEGASTNITGNPAAARVHQVRHWRYQAEQRWGRKNRRRFHVLMKLLAPKPARRKP